jgi:hypothetical protein
MSQTAQSPTVTRSLVDLPKNLILEVLSSGPIGWLGIRFAYIRMK